MRISTKEGGREGGWGGKGKKKGHKHRDSKVSNNDHIKKTIYGNIGR